MNYSTSHFHYLPNDKDVLLDAVSSIIPKIQTAETILDIGCGSGELLDAILARQDFAHCFGIDLSPTNVAEAKTRLGKYMNTSLRIVQGDYSLTPFEPAQIVVSSSTLHLIACPFEILFAKIGDEVASGGYLVFSVPTSCLYNKILMFVRRMLKTCDCKALRSLMCWLGHFCYPSLDHAVLKERIEYMFIVPHFLF